MATKILERMQASLQYLQVTDAVAMPVHWMYDLRNLKNDQTEITGYVKPKERFKGSIMSLSNTGGGGRGGNQGSIVGDVILHGKKQYWERGANQHQHVTLQAGENTLEASVTRLLARQITIDKGQVFQSWIQSYIKFMTTPDTHNDAQAATAHRMFFNNQTAGTEPSQCPDNDHHNVDAIDALTISVPVILRYQDLPADERNELVWNAIQSLRNCSNSMKLFSDAYADLLVSVIKGNDLKLSILNAANKVGFHDIKSAVENSSKDPMVACQIQSSFPALLFIAQKQADEPNKAILANANAGGENVARGSLLGALLGAQHGMDKLADWAKNGLKDREEIDKEINGMLNSFLTKEDL